MTLDAVAKSARVSTATVSRVLNDPGVVKESTRKRVLKAVDELNYHPNLHARSLAGGRTKSLGMIVSNIRNPFFVDIFVGMEAAARERGYEVLVEQTDYSPSQLASSVRSMIGRRVDGLAVIVSEMDKTVQRDIASSGLPAVFYDIGRPGPKMTNIRVRYEVGMTRMVEYLFTLGHRRMALLAHHSTLAPIAVRQRAFVEAVDRHHGAIKSKIIVNSDTLAGAMQAAHELLSSNFRPTAIMCVNDCMAIGAMRAVRSHGLRIPEDINISGFDNIEFSEFTQPALTTVNIPRRRIGEMAALALLEEPSGSNGREIVIEPELVVRDSTGPCPPQNIMPSKSASKA